MRLIFRSVAAPRMRRIVNLAQARSRPLGKRWNGVILGTLMEGTASFSELRRAVTGISDSVLSERLSELCAAGLVSRTVNEGPPLAVAYAFTESGAALLPALTELTSWARANLKADDSTPV